MDDRTALDTCLGQLAALCLPLGESYGDWLARPFAVPGRGVAASDARLLVLLDDPRSLAGIAPPDLAPERLARIQAILAAEAVTCLGQHDASAFRQRVAVPPGSVPCSQCQGGRVRCDNCQGDGQCECTCCDDEHACGRCDGKGKVDCLTCAGIGQVGHDRTLRQGRIGTLLFDQNVLARLPAFCVGAATFALACVAGKAQGPDIVLHVRGTGWVAVVMPLLETVQSMPGCPVLLEGE